MPNNASVLWPFVFTIALAMAARIAPLPAGVADLNPDWVLLALIYWSLATPEQTGVFSAWSVGLLVDVLTGRLLGLHALVYAVISYFVIRLHKRIRHYPLPQQSLFILFCLLLAYLLIYWIETLQGKTAINYRFWWPVISGALFWPVVSTLLRSIRIRG
jgi:rod shape-determining protein MreD